MKKVGVMKTDARRKKVVGSALPPADPSLKAATMRDANMTRIVFNDADAYVARLLHDSMEPVVTGHPQRLDDARHHDIPGCGPEHTALRAALMEEWDTLTETLVYRHDSGDLLFTITRSVVSWRMATLQILDPYTHYVCTPVPDEVVLTIVPHRLAA